jgi:hypothetical protein
MNNFKNTIQENSKMITNKLLKGKEFNPLFDDEAINYSMKAIFVIIAALVIPNISIKYITIFDNIFFKILFIGLVALIAFRDPVTSLLLSIIFILAIQRLHNEKINNVNKLPLKLDSGAAASSDQSSVLPTYNCNTSVPINETDINYNSATNEIKNNPDIIQEQNNGNFAPKDASSASRFTTDRQFIDSQSNIIPNSSYMSQVKTFESQFGAQGLDDGVQGYDCAYSKNLTQQASVFSL